jgi:hypothetical protein
MMVDWRQYLVHTPGVCGGQLRVEGTRLQVRSKALPTAGLAKSLSILLLLCAGGCATAHSPKGPATLPQPTSFHLTAAGDINLTPQMRAESGLPSTITVSLDAEARSEAISACPLQSRHVGHLSLRITNNSDKQPLANLNIAIQGESAGTPTEGLADAMQRFLDAAALIMRSSSQLQSPLSTTRPSP